MNIQQIKTKLNETLTSLQELNRMINESESKVITEVLIKQSVCAEFKITEDELMSKKKSGNLYYAKPMFAYLLFKHVSENRSTIASLMGRNSHSCAVNSLNRANDLLSVDRKFKSRLENIISKLNQQI